jgi:hypothetical protein
VFNGYLSFNYVKEEHVGIFLEKKCPNTPKLTVSILAVRSHFWGKKYFFPLKIFEIFLMKLY